MPTEKQRGLGSAHQDGSPADSSSVLKRPAGTRTPTRGSAGPFHHYRLLHPLPASAIPSPAAQRPTSALLEPLA